MAEKVAKQNFKGLLLRYFSEVLIIFIGISVSFLFDEWRENRKDQETALKHLTILKSNLIQDTIILSGMIGVGKKITQSSNKLAYFKLPEEISDSISFHIDNASSYLDFKSNQTAFEEIKASSQTNLIKTDSLKTSFLTYYTFVVPYCNEWTTVDKTHTMTQLIPEMSIYFPVVKDSLNLVSTQEKTNALRIKKLRNLLLTNYTYKLEVINTFSRTKIAAKNLLTRVEAELEKK